MFHDQNRRYSRESQEIFQILLFYHYKGPFRETETTKTDLRYRYKSRNTAEDCTLKSILKILSAVFHTKNLHPYEKTKKSLKKLMKKREILFDHMGDGDLDGYRTEFENQPNLKHLGYQTGGASKIKFLDDLYILF